jgi:hypothetical protein
MRSPYRLRNTFGNSDLRHIRPVLDAAERAVHVGIASAREAARQRFHHPATAAPERKCFRVIRRYTVNGELRFEDIGAFATLGNALSMSTREQGHAVILDPNNKTVSVNGQPIEERPA